MIKDAYNKLITTCKNAVLKGSESSAKLGLSFALGMYVAFSPFPGFHTLIILSLRWLLGLNLPILFVTASINNPWTMLPFYGLDYAFGYWFLNDFFNLNVSWMISLEKIFGMGKICLLSFLVGGNVLGIFAALVSYPISKKIFIRLKNVNKVVSKS
ncbi:DUF2062 domain-containing protein [Candidatus Babeliales bacterium]|nr:DUF2062 domain-containing protein [Candidatus Babeliales bacterium]